MGGIDVTRKSRPERLTYGMVGGGPGAFIGDVHRCAIRMDDMADLVAGVFSRSERRSREFGVSLGLDAQRLYDSFEVMAQQESTREDGIDFVVIVTPNASHYAACKAFLSHGIDVVCDKPLTVSYHEAKELVELAERKDLLFCVTYTYTGYPTVKQIASMVASGELGDIRFVHAEYAQQWLATRSEDEGNRQAAWRTDPSLSGKSNAVGDIGSHVENIIGTMTGLRIKRLSARLDTFVEGRLLDDNASIMVDYEGEAKGLFWVSQIAIGSDNGLRVRIIGSKGSIAWNQEDPDHFRVMKLDEPEQIWSRGRETFVESAQRHSRIPAGHPEGVFEAFANIYRSFTEALLQKRRGKKVDRRKLDFPTGEAGADGVRFINACVESSEKESAWISL